ncbi:MAG: GIY-YIG nuclease family protein [Planctomycetota bacterium]
MGLCYVYILKCSDGRRYYGSTNDLVQRLSKHRRGLVKTMSAGGQNQPGGGG